MDRYRQPIAAKEQKQRLAVMVIVAVVATVAIMPVAMRQAPHHAYYVTATALVPAVIAWLMVRNSPVRQGLALFRGSALALAFVGVGGIGLRVLSGQTFPWIKETVEADRFIPQAGAYLVLGLLGLFGSFAIDHGNFR